MSEKEKTNRCLRERENKIVQRERDIMSNIIIGPNNLRYKDVYPRSIVICSCEYCESQRKEEGGELLLALDEKNKK